MLLNHKPTHDELVVFLEQTSILNGPTFMSLLGQNVNIHTHWRLQREEIREHIQDLMVFKEYLSDSDLRTLGDLQDCQFFYSINAVLPITDNPQTRKTIAEDLWNAIGIARRLN